MNTTQGAAEIYFRVLPAAVSTFLTERNADSMYEITFQFENGAQEVKFSAAPGSTILEAAKSANVAIDAPCNGNGSCGKCRVKLVSGEVTGVQTGHISDGDYAAGWRLSCSTKPAGDITVLVPDIASAYQSRMKTADLSSGEEIAIFQSTSTGCAGRRRGLFTNDFVQAALRWTSRRSTTPCRIPSALYALQQDVFDGCTEVKPYLSHRQKACQDAARGQFQRCRSPVR